MELKILSFLGNTFENNKTISFTTNTKSGEITVLDKHESMISALVPGIIKIVFIGEDNIQKEKHFAIGKGIIEISNSQVKILTDMLVSEENIVKEDLEKSIQEAKKLKEKYSKASTKEEMQKFLQASEQLSKVQAKEKLVELSK